MFTYGVTGLGSRKLCNNFYTLSMRKRIYPKVYVLTYFLKANHFNLSAAAKLCRDNNKQKITFPWKIQKIFNGPSLYGQNFAHGTVYSNSGTLSERWKSIMKIMSFIISFFAKVMLKLNKWNSRKEQNIVFDGLHIVKKTFT